MSSFFFRLGEIVWKGKWNRALEDDNIPQNQPIRVLERKF